MRQAVLRLVLVVVLCAPAALWQEADAVQTLTVWRQAQECERLAVSPPPSFFFFNPQFAASGPGATTAADPLSGGATLPVNLTNFTSSCSARPSDRSGLMQCRKFVGMDSDVLAAIGGAAALARANVTAIHAGFAWKTIPGSSGPTTYCVEDLLRVAIGTSISPDYQRSPVVGNGWPRTGFEFRSLRLTGPNGELTGQGLLTQSDGLYITIRPGVMTTEVDPLIICDIAGVFLRVELDVAPATTGIPSTGAPTTGASGTASVSTTGIIASGAPTTGILGTQSTAAGSTARPNASATTGLPQRTDSGDAKSSFLATTTAVVLLVLIPVGIVICVLVAVVVAVRKRKRAERVRQETSGALGTEMTLVADGGSPGKEGEYSEGEYHNTSQVGFGAESGVGEYHNRPSAPVNEGGYHNSDYGASLDEEYHNVQF
jgi:hypothetical protein